MSIVRNHIQQVPVEDLKISDSPAVEDTALAADDKAAPAGNSSGILNVNLHGVYSADELMEGVTFNLSDFPVGDVPTNRVIVSEIASTAIGSHIGSNLTVSANLFNSGEKSHYLQSGVNNSEGWITAPEQDELVPMGYAPILNIMPNEVVRQRNVHYTPSSGVDDQLVQRYGHLSSGESLRKGVVAFPGENYYFVAKDHVVLDIIEKNWEALGQSVPHERVREGNWIKVSNQLVDKVLSELDSSVLKHMPLTDMKKLCFNVKAGRELAERLDVDSEFPLSLTLAVKYRNVAPELSDA